MQRAKWFTTLCIMFGIISLASSFQFPPVPRIGTWQERSGSVTTGGTSQVMMVANTQRIAIIVENPCSATSQGIATAENLFINFEGVSASTSNGKSVELQPCGSFSLTSGLVSAGAITVNAATSSHQYTAKEMQ